MNKFLRVLFILVILDMTGAIIFQLFFPTYMGSHLGYGISEGDWYLECGSSNHPSCCESQIRLVLSESCADSFDYWRPCDWD